MNGSVAYAAFAVFAILALGTACASSGGKSDTGSSGTGSEFEEAPRTQAPAREQKPMQVDPSTVLQPIYFDYDRFDIRSDARPILRGDADAINQHPEWGAIVVEGHCDERGSEEYNLALGERRANATKQYLVDLGVASSRLETVSFGEAKPSVMGHDESAWRYNRRAEFSAQ